MFTANRVFDGITHITDAMGVSFTLAEGSERAILFDAGYGTENAAAYVRTLTKKPVKVILSHGHHDHMLGARWFTGTWMDPADREEFILRTGEGQRIKVRAQAEGKGVPLPEDFMTAPIPMPEGIRYGEKAGMFDAETEELGGRTARIIHVPGHTPGSVVCWIPDCGLLLTGDDWNPCTWMWFPSSLPAKQWRDNMNALVRTIEADGTEIRHVLCSHQPTLREGAELKGFLAAATDEALAAAPAVDMGWPIATHEFRDDARGWVLVFDSEK